MAPIRVLIADASPAYRDSASRLLSTGSDVRVVGCTATCHETLTAVECLHPDLVLVDVALTRPNGLETARRIKSVPGAPLVIMLALDDLPDYWVAAASAGADGFIVKGELSVRALPLLQALVDEARPRPPEVGA